VLGNRGLDLLGEDLLAAGVDGDRIAAKQLDFAIGIPPSPIAGNGVADPFDDRERPRGLLRIAQIAQR
jgi:hypothetical protein